MSLSDKRQSADLMSYGIVYDKEDVQQSIKELKKVIDEYVANLERDEYGYKDFNVLILDKLINKIFGKELATEGGNGK